MNVDTLSYIIEQTIKGPDWDKLTLAEREYARGVVQLKRNLRFVKYYPSDVLWSQFWKTWHWCWLKKRGYL